MRDDSDSKLGREGAKAIAGFSLLMHLRLGKRLTIKFAAELIRLEQFFSLGALQTSKHCRYVRIASNQTETASKIKVQWQLQTTSVAW